MTPSINAAAFAVAEARSIAECTTAAVATKTEARNVINSRIGALDAERSGIVSARKAGGDDPRHGVRLALIAADREGLQELMAEADADLATARSAHQDAAQAVEAAEFALAREADRAMGARLIDHATAVGDVLLRTIRGIAEIEKKFGMGRPSWVLSEALAFELQRLNLSRSSVSPLP
jgi:hypothetical protein